MATLKIGRVGFDVTIAGPRDWQISASDRRTRHRLRGVLNPKTTLAAAQSLRRELLQQQGQPVAVTYDSDATFDGFYILTDVQIDANHADAAILGTGLFRFDIDLDEVGTAQATEFTSLIDGILIANDYTVIESEIKYTWSPPVSAEAVTGAGTPTGHTRTTADGSIEVYVGVDVDLDPSWSVDPGDFYKGACYIELGGYTRAGTDAPEDLTSWKIGNGLVEVFADGANNGAINLQHAVDETAYGFQIKYASTTAIPAWNYPSIVHNTPEMCVLSLVRDANESPPTDDLHYLELTIRRGCPFVYGRFVYTGAAVAWSVDRESTDTATSITPTGADGAMGIEDASDDGDGNRWFLASPDTTTKDTTNGGLDWASTTSLSFILGMEIDGSSAHARDDTGDVILQALGFVGETVRPSRR